VRSLLWALLGLRALRVLLALRVQRGLPALRASLVSLDSLASQEPLVCLASLVFQVRPVLLVHLEPMVSRDQLALWALLASLRKDLKLYEYRFSCGTVS
jgi:hypothetical protein